jgi:hypothetical protein
VIVPTSRGRKTRPEVRNRREQVKWMWVRPPEFRGSFDSALRASLRMTEPPTQPAAETAESHREGSPRGLTER